MFGSLADGLKALGSADVVPTVVAPPAPAAPPAPRAPKYAGLLSGGAGVIERGPRTSVGDGRLKRRPAPSVESVRSRLTRVLPVQLTRTARPGVSDAGTIIAAGAVPFTAASGTSRSLAAGRSATSRSFEGIIGGIDGAKPRAGGAPQLNAGDLVVLHAPDASIDLDAQRRPLFSLSGQARLTMTASDGEVLLDVMATEQVVIPPRTSMIGVQAGGDTAVTDGMAGWHERTRLARLNSRVAVGPGCTLRIDGVVSEAPPAWLGASEVLTQATAVTTRFAAQARTVAVILAGSEAPTPDSVTLELLGATRAQSKGIDKAPRVVLSGKRAVLLYDIKPVRGEVLRVRVLAGGPWRLAGVLAGDADSESLARTIATRGPESIAGRLLLAADLSPVSVSWVPAPVPGPQRAAAERKTAGRKTARRKGAKGAKDAKKGGGGGVARKSGVKKASGRKVAVKTAAARKKTV